MRPAPPTGLDLAWAMLRRPASHAVWLVIAAALPASLRERLGVRRTVAHDAEHRAAMLALRTANRALPARVTKWPVARAALGSQ